MTANGAKTTSSATSSPPKKAQSESLSGKRKREVDDDGDEETNNKTTTDNNIADNNNDNDHVEEAEVESDEVYNFNVELHPKAAKRRSGNVRGEIQKSTFDEKMDTIYNITPARLWSNMPKYIRFTIQGESFKMEDIVLVKHAGDEDEATEIEQRPNSETRIPMVEYLRDRWVAQILEVRAMDESRVYARVHWLYRPDDLELGGRQPHHGSHELIASNYMQVIDAQTVDCKVAVKQWNEYDDVEEPGPDDLYWRQTLNCAKAKWIPSQLRTHCICKKPRNPNKLLIQCKSPKCQLWLHSECIENAVEERLQTEWKAVEKSEDPLALGVSSNDKESNSNDRFNVKVIQKKQNWIDGEVAVKVKCTGPRNGLNIDTWEEDIRCLQCGEEID